MGFLRTTGGWCALVRVPDRQKPQYYPVSAGDLFLLAVLGSAGGSTDRRKTTPVRRQRGNRFSSRAKAKCSRANRFSSRAKAKCLRGNRFSSRAKAKCSRANHFSSRAKVKCLRANRFS